MKNRDFDKWLNSFQNTNRTYEYWVDYAKVIKNADKLKVELHILNSLIGSLDIEKDFVELITKYPKCLECIPMLIAVRGYQVEQIDGVFSFSESDAKSIFVDNSSRYLKFMHNVGLFKIIEDRTINNLYDYIVGIEVGLDSNARKNRGGHLMTKIVSHYFDEHNIKYETEVTTQSIVRKYGIDLSPITNNGQASKRFDYVISNNGIIYGIEVNFYSVGGSKLNEVARSYKEIAIASKNINNFKFIWITDGPGWHKAKRNLKETFDNLDHVYNLKEMNSGALAPLLES